jgi:hypothetical protein
MRKEYTSQYLKQYEDIKDKRALKATQKVEEIIGSAESIIDLYNLLDVKKYDIGGYRIRYGGKPEWRIRFDIKDAPDNKKEKIIVLQLVLPREKYEKYAHKKLTESVDTPKLVIYVTESQLNMLKNNKVV